MYKVFINDKPLIFADLYKPLSSREKEFSVMSDEEYSMEEVINKITKEPLNGIVYLSASPQQSWNQFTGRFTIIEASGGVVKNQSKKFLVIFRKKRWDLPKGKLDYNETPENAAVRETKEECGLNQVEIEGFLLKTYHTYIDKNKSILKKTHWFGMTTEDDSKLRPQIEEEIEDARWMTRDEILKLVMPTTYASIRDVLEKYFEKE